MEHQEDNNISVYLLDVISVMVMHNVFYFIRTDNIICPHYCVRDTSDYMHTFCRTCCTACRRPKPLMAPGIAVMPGQAAVMSSFHNHSNITQLSQ